jgi:mannosyl-oligosaccharide alpha-1,2-mannosidase
LGDSFYEYMLKTWIWSGRKDEQLKGQYDQAMDAIEKQLLFQSRQNQLWYFGEMKASI